MTHDDHYSSIHRAELDREIDTILVERRLTADATPHPGIVDRARRGAGRALIAAGTALAGRESGSMRTHRA
ncbi:MAG TPA: hypothetical protein VGJ71_14510 [Candidatus Limnocylindrales bacterium]